MASAKDYERKLATWQKSLQKWKDAVAAGEKPTAIDRKMKQANKDLQQVQTLGAKLVKEGKLPASSVPAGRASTGHYLPPLAVSKFKPSGTDTAPGQVETPPSDAQVSLEDDGLPLGKIAFAVVGLGAGLFLVKRFVLR